MIAGVDEAGRGCIVGSMFLCVLYCKKEDEPKLRKIGVKDSKLLSPKRREEIEPEIRKMCSVKLVEVDAEEITALMDTASLNEIEAMKIAHALNSVKSKPEIVYVDSPDNIPKNFELRIRKYLNDRMHIISQNKAESRFPIVAAASIVAKVARDAQIEKIKSILGIDFGSGYTSDPRTISFLQEHAGEPEVRKYLRTKWKTLDNIKQKTLAEF
ncbi:MAG: ribonuclease HII [Candidatus Micrarchaeia archaeon]